MSNEKIVRVTKKSRLVAEFGDCVVELVLEGNSSPSKDVIVEAVVDNTLGDGASTAIRTLLEDELANELCRYFSDIVRYAHNELEAPYHLVTKAYYDKRKALPETKAEARAFVSTFANGRSRGAAGVRFVVDNSDVDVYLAVVAEKRIDVSRQSVEKVTQFAEEAAGVNAIDNNQLKRIPVVPQ